MFIAMAKSEVTVRESGCEMTGSPNIGGLIAASSAMEYVFVGVFALVFTVNAAVAGFPCVGETTFGVKLQETPGGSGVAHDKLTTPPNGPDAVTCTVTGPDVAGLPSVMLDGEGGSKDMLMAFNVKTDGGDVNCGVCEVPVTFNVKLPAVLDDAVTIALA